MFKSYLMENFGYNEPIFLNDLSVEGLSENVIRQSLKSLCSDGFLEKYDNGIYYIPKQDRLLGKSYLDPFLVILRKYVQNKRTRYSFQRMENGHQEAMNRLWEQSNYKKTYLGEWHTHKQEQPQPSNIDIKNWITISSKKSNNSERLFFVIVGTKEVGVWTILNGEVTKLEMLKTNMEELINE